MSGADFRARDAAVSGAIIGFSFSLETGSVALLAPDGCVHERVLEGHRSHANDALGTLKELMQGANVQPAHIRAVAADVGPGGFTGLRTACGLAQGLAIGWGVPCVPVSSLMLMAHAHAQRGFLGGTSLTVLDARQGEVYAAAWSLSDGVVSPLFEPSLVPYATTLDQLNLPGASVCGPGLAQLSLQSGSEHLYDASVIPSAASLVRIAAQRLNAGNVVDAVHCQPLYVRHQIAQTTAQRRANAGG